MNALFAPTGIAAAIPLAVAAWDRDLRMLGWNPAAAAMFGWSAEEVLGGSLLDLLPTAMRERMQAITTDLFAGRLPVRQTNENVTKDGRTILCEWHNTLLHDEQGTAIAAIAVGEDVTLRKQAEAEYAADLERQRRLMEIAVAINASQELDDVLRMVRDAIVDAGGFDRAGVFRVENDIVRGAWGTDEQGALLPEHDFAEPLAEWGAYIDDLALGRQPFVIIDGHINDTPDSGTTPCAVVALRTGGRLVGLLCVDNLLTGRPVLPDNVRALLPFCEQAAFAIANTRLRDEQRFQQERQRRLTSLAGALCASTTLHEILRMVRDAIVDAGGFDRAGVFLYDRERNLLRGTWGTDRQGKAEDIAYQEYPVVPDDPMPMPLVARGELDYYLSSDLTSAVSIGPEDPMQGVHAHAVVPLRVNGMIVGTVAVDNLLTDAPITEEDVRGLLPFADLAAVAIQNARLFHDLTQARVALLRSEKLRAVGELASGVAHNVNNVLAAVLGYAELIQITEGATGEIKNFARTIERAALDGAEIVRRMQHFARTETETEVGKSAFDLAIIAQEAIDLTRPAWLNQAAGRGAKITLAIALGPDLWILGVASEMREVLVNLIKNAAEAMPQGGILTLAATREDGQAILTVQDTGVGMDAKTAQRVFEPFYTTKGTGLGLGLGLSVAWGIIQQHQGFLEVQSAPGAGAVFRISLPLTDKAPSATAAANAPVSLEGARILVVEDEELVLGGLARALMAHGASVSIATSAAEAQEWLKAHAEECDLILSDHGMVGLTGLELLAEVRARYPHLRRVLLSGWGTSVPGGIDTSVAEAVLAKPVQYPQLAGVLATLLVGSTG